MENKTMKLLEEKAEIKKEFSEITAAAAEKKIFPCELKFAPQEYLEMTKTANEHAESVMKDFYERDLNMHGPEHFSRDKVFVWGGPTPSWGGSMAKDTSIKAKEYFGLDNVMYVYGPMNDEMLSVHKDCKKVICHLGRNCRTDGAAMDSDAEEAELLSRMSLKYPNIVGGVVDDMTGNYGYNYSHREYKAIHDNLRKHNPNLELYGVVYSWEMDQKKELQIVSDCIDHVILWFWSKLDLTDMDLAVEQCRSLFPGKPIMLGIFMFDYGTTGLPNSPETMKYHLEKARRFLAAGKIQDIVILGDREIEKCPLAAETIRDFLQKEFSFDKSAGND